MKWERMQKPLRDGMQVFRVSWPDDQYLMVEDGEMKLFSADHPEGAHGSVSLAELDADDWAATGPSGN